MDIDKKDMLERVAKATCRTYVKGFAIRSDGNVSIRIQGRVYIPPSGSCPRGLAAEDMITLEVDSFVSSIGGPDYEGRWSSKEVEMHPVRYESRPDILCLSHLHPPYSTAMVCRRQEDRGLAMGMSACTPGYVMRVGGISAVLCYHPGSRELAEAVFGAICRRDGLLLVNHGTAAMGRSPGAVPVTAEEIEENAHLAILLEDQRIPLDEEQIEALFQTGGKV